MGYGKNLKKAIEQKGWTVAKCARDMQISPQTLYTIIRRDSSVRYTLAVCLADILGVDVAFITKDIPYDMEMLDFADCIHLVPVFAHVCGNLCFRFVERGSVIAVQHAVGLAVDGFGAVETQIDVSGVGSSLSDVLGCIMPFHALAHHRHICQSAAVAVIAAIAIKIKV